MNWLIATLIRLGAASKSYYLLTTRGRRTGRPHTTPVTVIKDGGQRWLVAPYGPVAWVQNARANNHVILTRGGRSETVQIEDVRDPAEAARVLKMYVEQVPIVRPYFQSSPNAPAAAFEAEVDRASRVSHRAARLAWVVRKLIALAHRRRDLTR